MAVIAKGGRELISEIDGAPVGQGSGAFWWLGQHSFVLKLGATIIYIDPYLEPNPARQTPPLVTPDEVTHADLVLCTHDHLDHIDPFAISGIARASARTVFVAPRPHGERMLSLGVPESRLQLLNDGEELVAAGLRISAVRSKHEFFDATAEGYPYLGYVVSGNGVCVYHSGDTLVYDGLATALRRWELDAAFLPINGRDAERYRSGCIGNMTYQEAVDLAGELRVGLAVPAHWDMFAGNSEDPQRFVAYLAAKFPDVPCWVGQPGVLVRFASRNLG